MIAELSLWIVLFTSLLTLKFYFARKEKHSVDVLKQALFEIVAKNKASLDKEGYVGQCGRVATLSISRVVEVIDSIHSKDKQKYCEELKNALNEFMDSYEGESEYDCEISNGVAYVGSVVGDIFEYLEV